MDPQGEFLLNEELPRVVDESLELLGRVVGSLLPAGRHANGTSSAASARSSNVARGAGRRSKYTEEFSAEENNTRVFLELDGCLIRKARVETKFVASGGGSGGAGAGFATELATSLETPFVLEQALSARKSTQSAMYILRGIRGTGGGASSPTFSDLRRGANEERPPRWSRERTHALRAKLTEAIQLIVEARNAFLLPNPLCFPQTLRPFNGFTPPLAREYHVEFSVFRSRLVVGCYRLVNLPVVSASSMFPPSDALSIFSGSATNWLGGGGANAASARGGTSTPPPPLVSAIDADGRQIALAPAAALPDVWFEDTKRILDLPVLVEPSRAVVVKDENTVSFQVASFAKALTALQEALDVVSVLADNVEALIQVEDFEGGEGGGTIGIPSGSAHPVAKEEAAEWLWGTLAGGR